MLSLPNPVRSLVLAALTVLVSANGAVSAGEQFTVEVFTTTDLPIDTDSKVDQIAGTVEIYEIDGIQRFEAELSRGLPNNVDAAKHRAAERIGQLDEKQMQRIKRLAQGLSKAMQYGIDRFPAIVFDGDVVVYGLTNLSVALYHFRRWRARAQP